MFDIIERLQFWARTRADHPAVVDASGQVSYGAFAQMSARIAANIAALQTARVAILLPQRANAYAAMFGAYQAGVVYAPLNITSPKQKLISVLDKYAPDLIVGDPGTRPLLAGTPQAGIPWLDVGAPAPDGVNAQPGASDLAYVIFTSGSTGGPKGVMIPRTALAHYCGWIADALGVTPDDRWSQHPNIGFDLSVLDIYGALTNGATLYPLNSAKHRLMPAAAIADHRLTIWDSVPSAVNLMRNAGQLKADFCKSVRLWMFCGEPLLPDQVESLFAATPAAQVLNMYGPTEATVSCTSLFLTPEILPAAGGASVALGEAIPGMSLTLHGGATADEGEILIEGPQLAAGYWNDAAATARAFRTLPGEGTRRVYFSGDWAERRNGHLFFKTRTDFQVKIRGFRIELDEVAAAIRKCGHPVVCVVKSGEELAAVIERGTSPVDVNRLQKTLSGLLDAHAIPAVIKEIDRLPMNDNGKIDAKAVVAWLEGVK